MAAGDFRRGLVDAAPPLPGIVPFEMVAGIASVESGLRLVETEAMSVVVFAGASQLAADKLLAGGAATIVAWRTENILATMATGMEAIWALQFVL